MPTYVALLRGVNVGGKNKLPMKQLALLFEEAGASSVRTYIQSGNVVFKAPASTVRHVSRAVEEQIEQRFGFRSPIVIRTVPELEAAYGNNPFLISDAPEHALHVTFLAEPPTADAVALLDPNRSPGDRFAVRGREIYFHLPNGAGRTKLTSAYFDARLKTTGTMRNWRTIGMLLTLMKE